jgi:hypothetical protein
MLTPHQKFEKTIERCLKLLTLHDALEGARKQQKIDFFSQEELCDLLRSAVVLSVSGMDAYFTDKYTDILIPFLKKRGPTKDLISFLSSAGLDTKVALEMLQMERPYRRIRTIVDSYLGTVTTQRANVIDELFLSYGLKDFTKHAVAMCKRRNLWRRIELLVERRHQIAHEADLNAHGKLQRIESKKVRKQIQDLRLFVKSADGLCDKIK